MLCFTRTLSKMKILFLHSSFILICIMSKCPMANMILRSLLEQKKNQLFAVVVTITVNIPNNQYPVYKHSGCTGFQICFR